MFLSAVSLVLTKLILTNKDGHFECFSLMKPNIRTYLEPRESGGSYNGNFAVQNSGLRLKKTDSWNLSI